jgi:hypothetical protein
MEEFFEMAFVISRASPCAFVRVLLISKISSRDVDAARNAIAVPTLPVPTIEINNTPSYLFYNQNKAFSFMGKTI